MSEDKNRLEKAADIFDDLFPLAKSKPVTRLEIDADLIEEFLIAAPNRRVYIHSSLLIWRAFEREFNKTLLNDYEMRESGKVVMHKSNPQNFIRWTPKIFHLRGRALDKNTMVVVTTSLFGLNNLGYQKAMELLEKEIKPRGCSTLFGDY